LNKTPDLTTDKKVHSLDALCFTPESKRDFNWERKFLDSFIQAKVKLLNEEPQQGPDGWPYMFVQSIPAAKESGDEESTEVVLSLLNWLKDKGIGLVVNPNKSLPDFIFTYGMIWNFAERNLLIEITDKKDDEDVVSFVEGDSVYFGKPSKELLPAYVVKVLLEFFEQQGVKEPRVAIIGKNEKDYDLCFSLESLGNPPEKEHQGILEAISWFLPTHYSLMLISEESVSKFFKLKDI